MKRSSSDLALTLVMVSAVLAGAVCAWIMFHWLAPYEVQLTPQEPARPEPARPEPSTWIAKDPAPTRQDAVPPLPPVVKLSGDGVLQLSVSGSKRRAQEEEQALRTFLTSPAYVEGGKTWIPNVTTTPLPDDKCGVVVTAVAAAQVKDICGWLGYHGWGWNYNFRRQEWRQLAGSVPNSVRVCRYHEGGRYREFLSLELTAADQEGRAVQEFLYRRQGL